MKQFIKNLVAAGIVLCSVATAQAQYPAEFTKDQADSTIAFRHTEISNLQADVNRVQGDVTKATADLQQRTADVNKCHESLYSMLGSDRNGYNAYRERLARAEQELNTLRSMSVQQQSQSMDRVNNLETEIRYLRDNKLVLVRDHYTRVQALSNGFIQLKRGLVPPNTGYTVGTWRKDRDCLWNIAKKPEIYNDPFAWPKIWRANMETIRNPDIIHPGQQLTIVTSPVTEQDRDVTGYRHRRR